MLRAFYELLDRSNRDTTSGVYMTPEIRTLLAP